MNVLIIATNGMDKHLALVPSEELSEFDLDTIEGYSNISEGEYGDQVSMLTDRLGIYPFLREYTKEELEFRESNPSELCENWTPPPFRSQKDLMKYLNPKLPFTVDKVVHVNYEK